MEHIYSLRYNFNIENQPEGYTKEDAKNKGLTDCLFGVSILLPEDGSYSQKTIISYNGKEKRVMTPDEIFKIWLMLGMNLHDNGELTGWRAEFAKVHAESARDKFMKGNYK